MSQEELALAAGVSTRTIQRVETVGSASMESRRAIAAVFDVDVQGLLKRVPSSPSGGPMNVFVGSVFLILAVVLLTFFGLAEILGPIKSLDSRDLLIAAEGGAALAFGALAVRRLRRATG